MTNVPGAPPQPYLEKWDERIVALQAEIRQAQDLVREHFALVEELEAENTRLRACLQETSRALRDERDALKDEIARLRAK